MAVRTWDGQGVDNLWSNPINWSGNVVPQNTDDVIFNATSVKNCTMDSLGTWSGGTLTIQAGYTGTITRSNIALLVALFSQANGLFDATGPASFTIGAGGFTLSGGEFRASKGMIVIGSMTRTGGTYTHNGEKVRLSGTAPVLIDMGGDFFFAVEIVATANITVVNGTTLRLLADTPVALGAGTLTIQATATLFATGEILITGSLDVQGVAAGGFTHVRMTEGALTVGAGATWPAAAIAFEQTFTSATLRTNDLGGKSFTWYARKGSGSGTARFLTGATFRVFQDDLGLVAHTLEFGAGALFITQIFRVSGSAGKLLTLKSTTDDVAWVLAVTTYQVEADYVSVRDSNNIVQKAFAGIHSVNVSGNTEWYFTVPDFVPGAISVDLRSDTKGFSSAFMRHLRVIARTQLELHVSFLSQDPTKVPPVYTGVSAAPDPDYRLRWIAKEDIDDADTAALWDVTGDFINDHEARLTALQPATDDEAAWGYSEFILTYKGAIVARTPMLLTSTKKGSF